MLLCLLIVVCIIASSSITFSAMPKGKFPIQIMSDRVTPNHMEYELIKRLEKAFNNSPNFRVTNIDENRIMLGILLQEYKPGIASSDVFATATPICVYSLIWVAKPKNKHANIIWHDLGRFQTYEQLIQYVLEEANTTVSRIKIEFPYIFN